MNAALTLAVIEAHAVQLIALSLIVCERAAPVHRTQAALVSGISSLFWSLHEFVRMNISRIMFSQQARTRTLLLKPDPLQPDVHNVSFRWISEPRLDLQTL